MLRLVRSLLRSTATAIRHDPEVERIIDRHPRTLRFLAARFDRTAPFGRRLTIGAAVTIVCLALFFSVVQDVVALDPLAVADKRIVALVQMYRAPLFDSAMLFITYLGNWQIILIGASLVTIGLALRRRWIWLATLLVSIGGGEALVWGAKGLLARSRPDLSYALVAAQGGSFPSGHAFVAISFYGIIAWFAISSTRRPAIKWLIGLGTVVGVAAIGFSRVYLGVHWPSDVLASFALGAAWLAALITAAGIAEGRATSRPLQAQTSGKAPIGALLWLGWIALVIAFFETHPLVEHMPQQPEAIMLSDTNFPASLFAVAPRFSEDIVGAPMEPINVILVGSEVDVSRALEQAGWNPTDPISVNSSWRLLVAELSNQPYPRAPGTPSFWNGNPNKWAFEQPTESNSARERHHLHLWPTPFRAGGSEVWVGTVHLDSSAKTSNGISLPIHQIDPALDRQREALRANLAGASCVTSIVEEPTVDPMLGHNAAGNPFFTDGKAIIADLKCK